MGFVLQQVIDFAGFEIVKQVAVHLHQAAFEMKMSDYKELVLVMEWIVWVVQQRFVSESKILMIVTA